MKSPPRRRYRLRIGLVLFYCTQETEVVLRETMVEDALNDQTSVKMDSALSYENEGFVLDLSSSSDNIAEVRESSWCFLILFASLILPFEKTQGCK